MNQKFGQTKKLYSLQITIQTTQPKKNEGNRTEIRKKISGKKNYKNNENYIRTSVYTIFLWTWTKYVILISIGEITDSKLCVRYTHLYIIYMMKNLVYSPSLLDCPHFAHYNIETKWNENKNVFAVASSLSFDGWSRLALSQFFVFFPIQCLLLHSCTFEFTFVLTLIGRIPFFPFF